MPLLDIMKNYQINKMLINRFEENIDILIELKMNKNEINYLRMEINNIN